MKIWLLILFLLLCFPIQCLLRDPFCKAERYQCIAIGGIQQTNKRLALLSIDGNCYKVLIGTTIVGHEVIDILKYEIQLRDEKGVIHNVRSKK